MSTFDQPQRFQTTDDVETRYSQPAVIPPYQYAPQAAPARTEGLAVASLVLGIVWVFWVGSLLAVIFGHVALHNIKRNGTTGRGMAIAGLALGYVGLVFPFLIIILAAAGSTTGAGS